MPVNLSIFHMCFLFWGASNDLRDDEKLDLMLWVDGFWPLLSPVSAVRMKSYAVANRFRHTTTESVAFWLREE